jgi:hypothetical protein
MIFKKTIKIFADIALLVSFILTYFLDLTGLELHQYLGIAVAGILAVHVITHWKWIMNVSKRLFKKMSGRVRIYYLLDGMLLLAIFLITITGVLISTWLDIFLSSYMLLRFIHIVSSIAGMLLLIVKMGMHWKFFTKTLNLFRFPIRKPPVTTTSTASVYTRREALKTISVISAVGVFGLFKAASALTFPKAAPLPDPVIKTIEANEAVPTSTPMAAEEPIPQLAQAKDGKQRGKRRGSTSEENLVQSTPMQQQQPTPEVIVGEQTDNIQPVEKCVIRCDKGCAFPGLCRRYIDENQNQLCDLGECLTI